MIVIYQDGTNEVITDQYAPRPKARFTYKGFTCIWNRSNQEYDVFTRDEMEQPAGMRYVETECATEAICREFIDSY